MIFIIVNYYWIYYWLGPFFTFSWSQLYFADHPEVIVLDPLDSVRKLCDRTQSYQIMKECEILEDGKILLCFLCKSLAEDFRTAEL